MVLDKGINVGAFGCKVSMLLKSFFRSLSFPFVSNLCLIQNYSYTALNSYAVQRSFRPPTEMQPL